MALLSYVLLLCFPFIPHMTAADVMWTPIPVDANSQIDLWTLQPTGCVCPWDRTDRQCACCVTDGGCPCGKSAPNRCTQCGLEEHCNHMCNMTIISTDLTAKSGKSFGQIKSPSLEGPDVCWYTFIPTSNQRVEVQIYRLLEVGKHNGTSCIGGFLQFASGTEPQYSITDNQICGDNERYSPPAVFFADDGLATLLFQITEKTGRSLFLAYFSFTSKNDTKNGVAYQPRGGMKLQNTDCDWLYQDFECNKTDLAEPCVLASPGYPGVYPPHRQCKYHITTRKENVQVRISFTALLLPQINCNTDYISIYQGSTTSSPLLTTLCGNQRKTLEYSGLNLLIEFSSGVQIAPFIYNGFVAILKFYEKKSPTEPPTTVTAVTRITMSNQIHPLNETIMSTPETTGCDILMSGNNTRSGHFDTKIEKWHPVCRLVFQGSATDVVHVSFLKYRLSNPSCKSSIEVIDGRGENNRSIEKICSPKEAVSERKNFLSTGNALLITLKTPSPPLSTEEAEFLYGTYYFHDEQISGTMQPTGLCDVKFNGLTSPLAAKIDNPGTRYSYWNIEGPLVCQQEFIPTANQSIYIKVSSVENMSMHPNCYTQCGDNGCRCVSNATLKHVDHLMLLGDNKLNIACLCGSFQSEGLPVSARTWGSLTLVYSVAHYSWKGFNFGGSYAFYPDTICGEHIYTTHSGEITMRNLSQPENMLNHFYHQSCAWILHSNVERHLLINITSAQNRPCTAWNITIHEYSSSNHQHLGEKMHTFCPRKRVGNFSLPGKLNTVVVRLSALSRTLPQFQIKWLSQVRPNARHVPPPVPAPNAAESSSNCLEPNSMGLLYMLLILVKLCGLNR